MSDQKPLDLGFNVMVMTMANKVCPLGYDVTDQDGFFRYPGCDFTVSAPTSLGALREHLATYMRILVDRQHSENTIFGDPEHNWAFRAWHDWTHWIIGAEFNLTGELAVAHRQIEDMHRLYGHGYRAREWAMLIMSEVYGQAVHQHKTGAFPEDQRAFTYTELRRQAEFALELARKLERFGGLTFS